MVFEEELVPSARGGRGRDLGSDEIWTVSETGEKAVGGDMGYAEKFLLVPTMTEGEKPDLHNLKHLANRKVLSKGDAKYKYTMADLEELKSFGFESESLSSCSRMINAVYVALEIPYVAAAYTSPKAEKEDRKQLATTKNPDGSVKHKAGDVVQRKVADRVKISKYADEWDPTMYACLEGKNKSSKYVTYKGEKTEKFKVPAGAEVQPWILRHDEPGLGVRKRVIRWIREVGEVQYPDLMKTLGMNADKLQEKLAIRLEEISTGEREEPETENGEVVSDEQITKIGENT